MKMSKGISAVVCAWLVLACFMVQAAWAQTVIDGYTIECTNGSGGRVDLHVSAPVGDPVVTYAYTYNKVELARTPPDEACDSGWVWVSWQRTGTAWWDYRGTHTFMCTTQETVAQNCVVVKASFPVTLQYKEPIFGTWVNISALDGIINMPFTGFEVPFYFPPTGCTVDGGTYAVIPEIDIALSEELRIYGSPTCSNLTFESAEYHGCDISIPQIPEITESQTCLTVDFTWDITIPVYGALSGEFDYCVIIPTMVFPGMPEYGIPAFDSGVVICDALAGLEEVINTIDNFTMTVACEHGEDCDCDDPNAVTLASFDAKKTIMGNWVVWNTAAEFDNAGFNVYRADSIDGVYEIVNESMVFAEGSPTKGASYSLLDMSAKYLKTYYYKLEDIDLNGVATMHGPVTASR